MTARTERLLADIALVGSFIAAFLTHENGALVHSVVSLVFTAVALHHVKHNWRSYRRSRSRAKGWANHTLAVLIVATTISGLVFWIAGSGFELAHGPLSVAAALAVVPHLWVHRGTLRRVLRRRGRQRPVPQVPVGSGA